MIIALVKETHPESKRVRYSLEKDGLFVDGTVTTKEDVARRMYEAARHSGGTSIWERIIMEQAEIN
jgi:hypothetical protein